MTVASGSRSTIAGLALVLALVGCPGEEPTDDTDLAQLITWEPALEGDERGAYLMAWSAQSGDLWVVGGQPDDGIVLRGTGPDDLASLALPEGTPLLNWVHGTSIDDVWVGGLDGTILRWDGEAWEDHSVDVPEAIWGVHAVSVDEVYAVGGVSAWGGETARIFRYDGQDWTSLALPSVLDDTANLFKAFHDSEALWACGLGGAVVRTTDGEVLDAIPTGYPADIVTVHGRPGQDPIFVGGRGTGAILEVDGDGLSVSTSTNSGLSGVHVMRDGRAVVVGERGYAAVFDPDDDSLVETLLPTDDVLHGVVVDSDGRIWVAGGNLYTSEDFFEGSLWLGTLDADAEEAP